MMLKKGEPFEIILNSPKSTPKGERVRIKYAFPVPHRDLGRDKYNLLKAIIQEDFPRITDKDLWTGISDFCPTYSFYITYEEYKGMLKKYDLEDVLYSET